MSLKADMISTIPNAKTVKTPAMSIAVIAWNKPIGLTSAKIWDDKAIAVEIPTKIKGINKTALAAPIRLILPKAVNNFPKLIDITANVPAINIDVTACDRPIDLTSAKIYDDKAIAVENPIIIKISDGIFLGSTSILAILSNAIAIRGNARASANTLTKLIFPTILNASPMATIPAAISIKVPTPSLIFEVSNPRPFFFLDFSSSSFSFSLSFSLPTSTDVSPFGTLVNFLGTSSFFLEFNIFNIVSWLSNILVVSSFKDIIPECISWICLPNSPLWSALPVALFASFLPSASDIWYNASERLSRAANNCLSIK